MEYDWFSKQKEMKKGKKGRRKKKSIPISLSGTPLTKPTVTIWFLLPNQTALLALDPSWQTICFDCHKKGKQFNLRKGTESKKGEQAKRNSTETTVEARGSIILRNLSLAVEARREAV